MNTIPIVFATLAQPTNGGLDAQAQVFAGQRIREDNCYIGKDGVGRPALIIAVRPAKTDEVPPPVRLENIFVSYAARCVIQGVSGDRIEGQFVLIHVTSENEELQRYFLRLCDLILKELPRASTSLEVSRLVSGIVGLFSALNRPPRGTIQGLWAELFLMVSARIPRTLIGAWHADNLERYDFGLGRERLEVKSSAKRTRSHHFSLEQAYPPPGLRVIVCSVFVESASGGRSLGELWDEVRDLVGDSPDLQFKVETICVEALGHSWEHAREYRFDELQARRSLKFVSIESIPRVSEEQPDGVVRVDFVSNLDRSPSLEKIDNAGPLLSACGISSA